MRASVRSRVAGGAALLLNFTCGIALATEHVHGPLELRLSLAHSKIVQSEPAAVIVEIRNVSDRVLAIPSQLEPERHILTFEIAGPAETAHRYQPPVHADGPAQTKDLHASEVLRYRQLLLYSADWGVHFKEPGQYRIRSIYSPGLPEAPDLPVRSNVVTLSVRPATGHDAAALEYFRGNPQARFALGGSIDPAIAAEFEAIIKKYPTSAYTAWSYYFLGRRWQRLRKPDADMRSMNAVRYFETLLERHPDFPLAIEVRYQIAKELLRQGKKDEAIARIEKLIEENPEERLLQRVQKQIRVYRDAGHEVTADALP